MGRRLNALIVDRSSADCAEMVEGLRGAGYDVAAERIESLETLSGLVERSRWDVILCDPSSDGFDLQEAIEWLRDFGHRIAFVLVTRELEPERLADYVRAGAHDVVLKDRLERLGPVVSDALESGECRRGAYWYEELLHGLDAIIWEADARTWEFSFVSDAAEEILGYPVSRWLAERNFWADHVHPDDRDRVVAECRRATERAEDHEFEYRALAADGRVVWIRDIVRVVTGRDGRAVSLRGVMVDVTRRRRIEEEVRFQAQLLDQVDAAVVAIDTEARITHWNGTSERMLGWAREEALGRDIRELGVLASDAAYVDRKMSALQDGRTWEGELTLRRKDGSTFPAYSRDAPVRDSDGNTVGFIGAMVDITERKQSEAALAESERRFRRFVEHSPDAIFLLDGQSTIRDVNESACDGLGLTRDELVGRSIREIDVSLDPTDYERLRRRAEEGTPITIESVQRRSDGTTFPVEIRLTLLQAGDEQLYLSFVRDISERRRAEEHIEYLAYHDDLTGLPNRGLFREHLELSLSRARRNGQAVAVLHVDLDRFKLVNDSLGLAAGDELLRQAASRLRECARTMDLVARHGSDEFLILLADLDAESAGGPIATAEAVARRVHGALERPFVLDESEFFIGGTIGISVFPVDADDAESLLAHAAAAVSQARVPGHGPWRFFSGSEEQTRTKLTVGTRLRKAVGRQEFVLHYQPVVDLRAAREALGSGSPSLNGEVVGVEALIRWNDPERGLVPPLEFIALAEDTGLIEEIGDWVVEEVCRQTRSWRDAGHDLSVAFNVSPRQLWQPRFAEKMLSDVRAAGVDPSTIVVEITESAAMSDPLRTEATLHELCNQGFTLAIDDFGAGHSSLTRLSQMPVRKLKLDKSFVSRLPHDETGATLVTAMIQLADNLGMLAHAEGIETEEQLDFLVERGCALGQGYLFSRPVPADELTSLRG